MKRFCLALSLIFSTVTYGQQFHDDEIRQYYGELQAWNSESKQWQSPQAFWQSYGERKGGISWGKSKEYPEYEEVKEGETLLIELESGTCLMEFFHSRWRRANDVRRWDDAFNQVGSCPDVFK